MLTQKGARGACFFMICPYWGMRTVVLTIVISAVAAWLKPIKTEDDGAV